MKKYTLIGITIMLISSCKNEKKEVLTVKERFDKIESITGGNNWEIITPHLDTAYIYFSRVGDAAINVYSYQVDKGDSISSRSATIGIINDSIYWNQPGERWCLRSVNDSVMEWQDVVRKSNLYNFQKKDSTHIIYTMPGNQATTLTKTQPLTLFLVRKKYDYTHGTDLASKDTTFAARPK